MTAEIKAEDKKTKKEEKTKKACRRAPFELILIIIWISTIPAIAVYLTWTPKGPKDIGLSNLQTLSIILGLVIYLFEAYLFQFFYNSGIRKNRNSKQLLAQ